MHTNCTNRVKWSGIHAGILAEVLKQFTLNNIRYFILRNYEGLPEINNSQDVDIIIEPGGYSRAALLLKDTFVRNNIENIHIVKYDRVRCWYGTSFSSGIAIHIDLIEGYLSKGIEIFHFEELYRNTMKYKDMFVLNNSYDTVMLIIYKLLMAKELSNKYRLSISEGYNISPTEIEDILNKKVGKQISDQICSLIKDNEYDRLELLATKIAKIAKRKAFLRKPFITTLRVVKFFLEKVHRIVLCPRKFQSFISVLGPDGTGKSTFIDGLVENIALYYVSDSSKCHIYHHRPTVLPNLGEVGEKAGVHKVDKDFTNPHRGKPTGFFSSFVRMIYYWLDYVIGVPYLLRRDVQFDRFTIYDRYIYDFLVDPKRSRINLPYWIRKTFTRLVPQPRIVFILSTDAEIIYKRKQELTPEEIKRQLGEFNKLAQSNKRFVVLDASKSPEELVKEATRIILDKFTKKV